MIWSTSESILKCFLLFQIFLLSLILIMMSEPVPTIIWAVPRSRSNALTKSLSGIHDKRWWCRHHCRYPALHWSQHAILSEDVWATSKGWSFLIECQLAILQCKFAWQYCDTGDCFKKVAVIFLVQIYIFFIFLF